MNSNSSFDFRLTAIAVALLGITGPVQAAEGDALKSMITPDSSVDVGGGYVDSDSGYFGEYNGLNEKGGYLLLDGDIKTRDDLTGTWMRLRGRNLGLDSRELRWDHNRQGNWGYYLEYNELPRFEPLDVTSSVLGIGSTNLTAGTVTVPVDIETKRKRFSLGFDKMFASNWNFKVDFRNETKKGERIFGAGGFGGGGINFLAEPIDSTIRLLDATVGYNEGKLNLVGGIYGTEYRNDNDALTWNFGQAGALSPIALPPDNQSYQLYVTGGYSFTPTTRGTFKVAYTKAEQNDNFIEPMLNNTRTDLGGKMETTLVQAGISARPMPKLSLSGNFRYEERDDKTPIEQYIPYPGAGQTWDGMNEPRDVKTTYGKVEASYGLPMGFRAIGEIQYEQKDRNTYTFRSVSHRDKTDETSYTAAVRRSISETVTGGLSYTFADRNGSDFFTNFVTPAVQGANPTVLGSNRYAPLTYADRKRDKIRLSINWMPVEPLSLQFYADDISDRYNGDRDGTGVGPRKGEQRVYAVDAAYSFNQKWQATAWYNYNQYKWENTIPAAADTWKEDGDAFGVGFRGKPNERIEVGADYSYSDIQDKWTQQSLTAAVIAPLPEATTRITRLNLFGTYAFDKSSGVRLDYIYDRFSTDDPTWNSWVYSPANTTVTQPSPQKVNFVGLRYFYKFR